MLLSLVIAIVLFTEHHNHSLHANSSLFLQYSPDAVRAEWPHSPRLLPFSPRFYHAGGDHESDRGDTATSGAADDDQENAGEHLVA